ncbi:MAG: hypothetical protein V2I65_14190 [Paracoccaceae bacterium]|jgi:hypothetical protein|nr:hypothetical protein [Paracoccaceae bacterium]
MAPCSTRICGVTYDAARRLYSGDVIYAGPEGLLQLRVSAPGVPGWSYERTLHALSEAGARRRAEALR